VASEDTVLYTAQTYVNAVKDRLQWETAKQQLAPLIRCQHLSWFWLSAAALSADAPTLLLPQQAQLRQLLMLQHADSTFEPTATELEELLPGAPSNWCLPERVCREVSSVQLVWSLDVEEIRAAAHNSGSQQKLVNIPSECVTPPLGGVVFRVLLQVVWDAAQGAVWWTCLLSPRMYPKMLSSRTASHSACQMYPQSIMQASLPEVALLQCSGVAGQAAVTRTSLTWAPWLVAGMRQPGPPRACPQVASCPSPSLLTGSVTLKTRVFCHTPCYYCSV